jgi:hypothetical protein
MTGKGRSRRKKKKLHQRAWFQATGIVLALAVVGTLLFLVFRPPSPDALYQQAKKLMDSPNFEDHEKALDGPIEEYLRRYDKRDDQQTKMVREWRDKVGIAQKERLLQDYLQREHDNSRFKRRPEDKTQEEAFAAALAEDKGDPEEAERRWKAVKQEESPLWMLVADRHLHALKILDGIEENFQKAYQRILRSVENEQFTDPREQQAFLAWRAENFGRDPTEKDSFGDRLRAQTLLHELKDECAKDTEQHLWYLYASWKGKQLAESLRGTSQKDDYRANLIRDQLKQVKNDPQGMRICLDIIAIYGKDDKYEAAVKKAEELYKNFHSR